MTAANKRTTDMNAPPATAPMMAATGVEELSGVDVEGEVSGVDGEGAKKKKAEGKEEEEGWAY